MTDVHKELPPLPHGEVERVVAFHGHMCPGLALGIRAAQFGLAYGAEAGWSNALIAVVETDMCAADAVQVLTGATFGNGQLMHQDFGKNAFTFYDRAGGSGVRAVARPDAFGPPDGERSRLMAKQQSGQATPDERQRLRDLQATRSGQMLDAPLDVLFAITPAEGSAPVRARPHATAICDRCSEPMMMTRSGRSEGRLLCIPCLTRVEGG